MLKACCEKIRKKGLYEKKERKKEDAMKPVIIKTSVCKICECDILEERELCFICEDRELKRNGEKYIDLTAYQAIKNAEEADDRFHNMLRVIFEICDRSEFQIQNRIVFMDKKTGKIYK